MKKIASILLVLSLLVLSLGCFAAAEEEKELNIFTWAGYFDETTLAQFEDETGIKVNYSVFASNEEMLLKMQTGTSDYDIILAGGHKGCNKLVSLFQGKSLQAGTADIRELGERNSLNGTVLCDHEEVFAFFFCG